MQKFGKSVKIWQSYREFKGGNFFETQCINSLYIVSCNSLFYFAIFHILHRGPVFTCHLVWIHSGVTAAVWGGAGSVWQRHQCAWPGVEPTTSASQVRRPARCAITPRMIMIIRMLKASFHDVSLCKRCRCQGVMQSRPGCSAEPAAVCATSSLAIISRRSLSQSL